MVTHVKVEESTRDRLNLFKTAHGLKSVDSVIVFLLDHFADQDAAPPVDAEPQAAPAVPQGKREIRTRDPLFSYDSFVERHGMMEHYTGQDQASFDLIVKRLEEVSGGCFSSAHVPFGFPGVIPARALIPFV